MYDFSCMVTCHLWLLWYMVEVVDCIKCPWYSDHHKLNIRAVWVVGSAIRAGYMMVSVLGSQWTFLVWSLLVAILGLAIVGFGSLIIVIL